MRILVVVVLIALGGLSGGGVYVGGALSGWWIEKQTPEALTAQLAPHIQAYRPEGAGPFPVVLQFSGCGGHVRRDGSEKPIMGFYAEAARAAGVGALIVDSMQARDIARQDTLDHVCTGQRLRGAERAGDVLAAMDYARSLDWVDPQRIALAGWSHGGWAIMDLMTMDLEDSLPHNLTSAPAGKLDGLRGAYIIYPYMAFPARTGSVDWQWTPDTVFVIGSNDNRTSVATVTTAAEILRADGVPTRVTVIDGATHAFDEQVIEPGSTSRFDREIAEQVRDDYVAWLLTTLEAG